MMNTTEQRHQAVFEDCNNNKQKNPRQYVYSSSRAVWQFSGSSFW